MNDGSPQIVSIREQNFADAIAQAKQVLSAGELIVLPTETVYGVAAHPALGDAVAKLAKAKARDADKPIAFLASDMEAIRNCGAVMDPAAECLAEAFWPGPLTLVLPLESGGTEGFRIPDHDVALAILRAAGGLLRVSSANESGNPDALTATEAVEALGSHVTFVMDSGPARGGLASTVVRSEGNGIEILREGAIQSEAIHLAVKELQLMDGKMP